jgi:beta-glucosidase-like glycosyl hydrolase
VLHIPFEIAVLDGDVDSVMNSYAEVDGMPVASDAGLLTTLLREKWGFTGTAVADYFAVELLQTLHGVAADLGDAGEQALFAGIDVELPTGVTYLKPLAKAICAGKFKEEYVDRALRRVFAQKEQLRLLAPDYDPAAQLKNLNADGVIDLDWPEHRALARELTEEAIVLLANESGVLPLDPSKASKIAVIGPNADGVARALRLLLVREPRPRAAPAPPRLRPSSFRIERGTDELPQIGLKMTSVLNSMKEEFGSAEISYVKALEAVDAKDGSKIAEAVEAAKKAEVAVVVVGDRAGLFGRGTSGEGCDAEDLDLPGLQVCPSSCAAARLAQPSHSASSWRRSSPRARPSCSCCSPAGRTRSTGRSTRARPCSRRSSRARRAAARSRASSPGA